MTWRASHAGATAAGGFVATLSRSNGATIQASYLAKYSEDAVLVRTYYTSSLNENGLARVDSYYAIVSAVTRT